MSITADITSNNSAYTILLGPEQSPLVVSPRLRCVLNLVILIFLCLNPRLRLVTSSMAGFASNQQYITYTINAGFAKIFLRIFIDYSHGLDIC